MNVYQCRLCGTLVMQQGLAIHMIWAHKLHPEFYGPTKIHPLEQLRREPDQVILYPDVPRAKNGLTWDQGYTVAYWRFMVQPPYGVRMMKGDLRLYKLWITQRIHYVRRKYGRQHMESRYMTDYAEAQP